MDTEEQFTAGSIMGTPPGLPQANKYIRGQLYVRDCYPEYYEMVQKELEEYQLITVTGTPGIGKSLFYMYYFKRYRKEHPNEKVLTASFTRERKLKQCILWEAESAIEKSPDLPKYSILTSIPDEACNLYLYDGPPDMEPNGETKMVAFPSPNAEWLDMTAKYEGHLTVYMPNWEPLELKEANDVLDLKLKEKTLDERIALFGGTARYTLTNNEKFLQRGKKYLNTALSKITTRLNAQQCFEGTADLDLVVHRLMHYCVDVSTNRNDAQLRPASKLVATMMNQKLDKNLEADRQYLVNWLDGAGKASAFLAWLFENFAHEMFFKGGSFQMTSLGKTPTETVSLQVGEAAGHYKRFRMDVALDELFTASYQMPEASNLQSIDSFVQTEEGLFLFQMTTSFDHTEDLDGILKLLNYLKLFAKVKSDPTFAKLVFVVPSPMVDSFKKQKISDVPIFHGRNKAQILASDCHEIKGIGPEKKRKLNDGGIRTVGDVLRASKDNELRDKQPVRSIRRVVEEFQAKLDSLGETAFIQRIPQYVIGIDYKKAK